MHTEVLPSLPRSHGQATLGPRARLPASIASALLCSILACASTAAAQETGRIGSPDSWKSAEFRRMWQLEAINAHHAYARGLTGQGLSVGQYDDGTALTHPEFVGRGHLALRLAESGCQPQANAVVLRGEGRCFSAGGDELTEEIEYVAPATGAPYTVDKFEDHGTHTAGPIAAARDGRGMHGVAFDSRLVVARFHPSAALTRWQPIENQPIADSSALSSPETILSLYSQWRQQNVDVANMELWQLTPASATTVADLVPQYQEKES